MSQIENEILDIFKRNNSKQENVIPPNSLKDLINKFENKNDIHDVIDDLIMRGIIIESTVDGNPTFKLTKNGYEYITK